MKSENVCMKLVSCARYVRQATTTHFSSWEDGDLGADNLYVEQVATLTTNSTHSSQTTSTFDFHFMSTDSMGSLEYTAVISCYFTEH